MKKPRVGAQQNTAPSTKEPERASARTEDPSGRQFERRRPLLPLIALLAALLTFAYTRRETLREKWLEAQPTEHLRQVEVQSGADTLVHLLYARRLVDAGAATEAVPPITRAVETLSPSTAPDLLARVFALAGYVAAQTGQSRRAENWLQRAASLGRDDLFLSLGQGILAIYQRRAVAAVTALTKATRLAPSRAEAWSRLGAAFMLGAEPERALAPYRRAVTLAPRDPQIHAALAQALSGCTRYAEAQAEFRIAADLAPHDPNYTTLPAIGYANSARTEAQYHQAAGLLQAALVTRPQENRLRAVLASLHLRFGQCVDARRDLEIFLARSPENAVGWHNLATACERLGDRRAAAAAHARYQRLIDFLFEAAERKREALLHRDDPGAFLRLAEVCRRAGKNQEAYGALQQAAKLRPDDPQIARTLRAVQATLRHENAPPLTPPDGAEQE